MSSTESSTPTEAIQQALEKRQALKQLATLVGVDSLDRNLQLEDSLAKRQADADHRSIYGGGEEPAGDGGEDMGTRYLVAGDLTINAPSSPSPAQAAAAGPASTTQAGGAGTLARVAAATALAVGGLGAGYGLSQYLTPDPPAATSVDRDTIGDLDFGE